MSNRYATNADEAPSVDAAGRTIEWPKDRGKMAVWGAGGRCHGVRVGTIEEVRLERRGTQWSYRVRVQADPGSGHKSRWMWADQIVVIP